MGTKMKEDTLLDHLKQVSRQFIVHAFGIRALKQ